MVRVMRRLLVLFCAMLSFGVTNAYAMLLNDDCTTIHYTSTDGKIVTLHSASNFDANVLSNTYENGQGVITFDKAITRVGSDAFRGNNTLASVVLPASVTSVGATAFYGCNALVDIALPADLTRINDEAFAFCSAIKKVTIPSKVTYVGDKAFVSCSSLDTVYVEALVPPTITWTTFIYADPIFVVPCTVLETYTLHSEWGKLTYHLSFAVSEETVTACRSYDWFGQTYRQSGDYTYYDENCVKHILHLTINKSSTSHSQIYSCDAVEWGGMTLTESGSYCVSTVAANGCDSIIFLDLVIYDRSLPDAISLPVLALGMPVDVSISEADIRAYIADKGPSYAPNADIEWWIKQGSSWTHLTSAPIAEGTSRVCLRYDVVTDCGTVASDDMVISVLTTSFSGVDTPVSAACKLIRNGQLFILHNGRIYNAQGVEIN